MDTNIFDKNGVPVAYHSDEFQGAIFLWSGEGVAHLIDNMVYGWLGKHIGWLEDGVFYEHSGYRIGFTEHSCPYEIQPLPKKERRKLMPRQKALYMPKPQPKFRTTNRGNDLKEFLSQNANKDLFEYLHG